MKINQTSVQKRLLKFFWKHPRLLDFAQNFRYLVVRGPLQNIMIRYHQKKSTAPSIALPEPSLFPELDVERTLDELDEKGYSIAFELPEEIIEELIKYQNSTGSNQLHHPHKHCAYFNQIACDAKIIAVARRYIGAEPILYSTSLYYTGPLMHRTGKFQKENRNPKIVHFDADDYRGLTLFIYLTDVDEDTSPHVVIEGTHKHKKLRDLVTRWYTRENMEQRFGSKMKTIVGPAGLAFFEDTSAFHIQSITKHGRFTARVCYTLQRSPELARYHT